MTGPDDPRRDAALAVDLLAIAGRAADAARAASLSHFRAPGLHAANKAGDGFDPVTDADRAAEVAIRDVLRAARPDDGIVGEESPDHAGGELTWIVDPIDGTRAFLIGAPTWTVLIALSDAEGPVLGVIDQPYTTERFAGRPGWAQMSGPGGHRPLATAGTAELGSARLHSTFPEIGTAAERTAFRRVAEAVRLTRYGLDGYAYALLAAGHLDLVVEAGLAPYDVAAPVAVVQAAGGVVTDWEGGPAHRGGRVLAAANRGLHAAAVARLRG